jgi:hypothetical protein
MSQTQELSTVNILSLFETTKAERASFVSDVVSRLNEGVADPIKVHLQVKAMEDVVKSLNDNKEYKSLVLDAAEKNGKKFTYQNAEFSIREVGTKYDYSNCGDSMLAEDQAQLDALTEKVKARQKFLQAIGVEGQIIITEDGEAVKVYPPSKSSTTSVAVTLK